MDEPTDIQVAILAEDQLAAERWSKALQGLPFLVWRPGDALRANTRFDVIITDQVSYDVRERGAISEFWEKYATDAAVIRVHAPGPADLHLEADVTDRELRLACRLLALVTRLRRQDRAQTAIRSQLLQQALTDPLTGLPNRRAWDQRLHQALGAPAGSKAPLCLAIVDLDRFKQLNDQFGHIVGDRILQETGKALVSGLRMGDLVCRLGGDEFGLLLAVPDPDAARQVIQRVRNRIPHCLSQAGLPAVTASAGLAVATPQGPASEADISALLSQADVALQRAKRAGRDRTEVA